MWSVFQSLLASDYNHQKNIVPHQPLKPPLHKVYNQTSINYNSHQGKNLLSAESSNCSKSYIAQLAMAMRNLTSPSVSTPPETHIPMWDSSDPTRNPPPMPLHPDSPNLTPTTTGNGPVSGSPFKVGGGIIRQPFHNRNSSYMSINEERLQEILEVSRDNKTRLELLHDLVRDASLEPSANPTQSQEYSKALSSIIEAIEDAKKLSQKASESVRENMPMILSSLDTERESHNSLTTVVNVLLDQTKEVFRRFQTQEANMKKLLEFAENQESQSQRGGGVVTNEDLDKVMTRKNNVMLDEFANFADNMGTQQQQTVSLLKGLKEYFDKSGSDIEQLYQAIRDGSDSTTSEINKSIKRFQEATSGQLNSIPGRIASMEDCLTTQLDKAILNLNNKASSTNSNDHLIPIISDKLNDVVNSWERLKKDDETLQSKKFQELEESIKKFFVVHEEENQHVTETISNLNTKHIKDAITTGNESLNKQMKENFSTLDTQVSSILANIEDSLQNQQTFHSLQNQTLTESVCQKIETGVSDIQKSNDRLSSKTTNALSEKLQELKERLESASKETLEIKEINVKSNGQCLQQVADLKKFIGGQLKEDLASIWETQSKTQTSHLESLYDNIDSTVKESLHEEIPNMITKALTENNIEIKELSKSGNAEISTKIDKSVEGLEISISNIVEVLTKVFQQKISDLQTEHEQRTKEILASNKVQETQLEEKFNTVLKSISSASEAHINSLETMVSKQQQEHFKTNEQNQKRIEQLESELEAMKQRAVEAEKVAKKQEEENLKLKDEIKEYQKEQKLQASKFEMLKYMNWDLERHETKIQELENKTQELLIEKHGAQAQLSSINSAYNMRLEELEALESRIETFERRLNQTILNKSKSILGSTTMTIINSGGHHQLLSDSKNGNSNNNTPAYHNSDKYNNRLPVKKSGSKRHLSLAPENFERGFNNDSDFSDDDSFGKENISMSSGDNALKMMKHRGNNTNVVSKQRSISMFTPPAVASP